MNEFRSKLAWTLIENDYLKREEANEKKIDGRRVRRRIIEHKLETAPVGATNWDGQKWEKRASSSILNSYVGASNVKKLCGPIVYVMWVCGCVKIASRNIL